LYANSLTIEVIDRLLDRDLSHLAALEIQLADTETISKEWWCTLFARTPELRQLSIGSHHEAQRALEALHSDIAIIPGQGSRPEAVVSALTISRTSNFPAILLSHLTELFVRDEALVELLKSNNQITDLEDPDLPIHHLAKYLEIKKDCDLQLERLTICTHVSADAPQLSALQALARDVAFSPLFAPHLLESVF
jgi:hypothetical protein